MLIHNETHFPCFVFESLDRKDHPIDVVFCRATYDLTVNGLVVAAEQSPVVLADIYRDQPLTSSVQIDTDLVPTKVAADITVNAIAHAPGGKPLDEWSANVRVGTIAKTVNVTGPRYWQHTLLRGWHLSRPEPVGMVPLQYEYAFGGRYEARDAEEIYEQNPVGRGFTSPRDADQSSKIPAPQIETPGQPIVEFGKTHPPAGLGPIAKHWLPRRSLCGTADEHWKQTRWPLRPLDFDFRYYNSASDGLVYPGFLRGNEDVLLTGFSPAGPVEFSLPSISLTLFALSQDNEITLEAMLLDTLHIDTITKQVFLTWRLTISKTSGLHTVQIIAERVKQSSVPSLQDQH